MKRRVSLEYLGYTVPVRGDGECWGRAEELQGGQSPKRQCLQVGLKTLDLKDVAKILIIYSQFSSHTMLKFKVSTLCNSLLSHLFSFNWKYIWSFKDIFLKWLKGPRNKLILLQNRNLFMRVTIWKVGLLLTMFPYYREVDSINFHPHIGNKMCREFYSCCASNTKKKWFYF